MNNYTERLSGNSFRIIHQNPAFESFLIRRFLLPLSILLSFVFLPPPASASSCFPLPSGAAHWRRAEGNAQDSIGLNHGALEGGALYETGKVGQGFSFDGVDDLVEMPTQGFPAGTSDRTLEAWVKIDALVAQEAYFAGYGLFGAMGASYNIGASFGRLYFSSWGPDLFGPQVVLGQWHHVAATNVGSLVTLYLDGMPVNSASLPIDVPPEGTQFFIGKVGGQYGDIRRLQGQVDEVTLYSRALTPEEIAAIYQAGAEGKCAPESPTNHPPILSFSQDTGYLTDGVNPDKGELNAPFAFRVAYQDQDNDAPNQIRLVIEREDAATAMFDPYLENTLSPADPSDTNYADGKKYERTVSFPQGVHYRYYFTASDGEEAVRLPATDYLEFSTGHSSIAFIPGIQASRLYRQQTFENQLWEPNAPLDVDAMYMNEDGTSEDPDIYTRDVIDETNLVLPDDPTGLVLSFNVYKKFMASLDDEVSAGSIAAWKALPYDWRLPFEDVIKGGVETDDGNISYLTPVTDTPYMIQQLESLVADSANSKVSLVTHSMGGLIAKTLLIELQRMKAEEGNNLIDHIDRLIMVAHPQLGTPKAVASLLHGDEQSIPPRKFGIPLGFIVSQEAARRLGQNMVSAYSLIPSSRYFQIVDTDTQPLIEFAPELDRIAGMRNLAGQNISNEAELRQFLTGNLNGWTREQAATDTDVPNVLLPDLLNEAKTTHDAIDAWTPPAHLAVYQVAGWGADTISGIRYDDCDTPFCIDTIYTLDRKLLETQEGDGTVVVASATVMDTQILYLNLPSHNGELRGLRRNRSHADILEVEQLQELIKQIIHDSLNFDNLPTHFSLTKPEPKADEKKLRIRGLSPISIDVNDTFGNHTGPVSNSNGQLFE